MCINMALTIIWCLLLVKYRCAGFQVNQGLISIFFLSQVSVRCYQKESTFHKPLHSNPILRIITERSTYSRRVKVRFLPSESEDDTPITFTSSFLLHLVELHFHEKEMFEGTQDMLKKLNSTRFHLAKKNIFIFSMKNIFRLI